MKRHITALELSAVLLLVFLALVGTLIDEGVAPSTVFRIVLTVFYVVLVLIAAAFAFAGVYHWPKRKANRKRNAENQQWVRQWVESHLIDNPPAQRKEAEHDRDSAS